MFLFLPGIIATSIVDMLTSHRKRQPFYFFVHSYLIGVLSYGILILLVYINNKIVILKNEIPTWEVHFLKALFYSEEQIIVLEVFLASLIGALLAIILSLIISEKYFYKSAKFLGISDKHGDGDVWDFLLSSNDVEWVNIRDKETGLVYQGAVHAYSQKDDKKEIILSQVIIYRDTKKKELKDLYEMPFVYLNFDVNANVIIEVYEKGVENDESEKSDAQNQSKPES